MKENIGSIPSGLEIGLNNKSRFHHVIEKDDIVIEVYHYNALSLVAAETMVRKLTARDSTSNYTVGFLKERAPYNELNPVTGASEARIHGKEGYHIKQSSCRKVASLK